MNDANTNANASGARGPRDSVEERRARIARLVALGKRIGYSALLVAIVAFFVASFASFPQWAVTTAIVALVVACVVLPVPIVLGYGVRAAERDERTARQLRAQTRSQTQPRSPGDSTA